MGGGGGQFSTTSIGHLLSLVIGIRRWLYRQRSELGRSLKHAMICSRLGTHAQQKEKHRARPVVRIVMASVPQLVFANFLRMLFLAPVFALVLAMWSLYVRHRSRVTPR